MDDLRLKYKASHHPELSLASNSVVDIVAVKNFTRRGPEIHPVISRRYTDSKQDVLRAAMSCGG